jgi:hypothetical protein
MQLQAQRFELRLGPFAERIPAQGRKELGTPHQLGHLRRYHCPTPGGLLQAFTGTDDFPRGR